jgi:hypothetical protein
MERVRMAESFNYVSFGNWDYLQENSDVVTMGRGRMFEYTPSDTEKRLASLDASAAAFLEKLPTFLCSEIESEDNTSGDFGPLPQRQGTLPSTLHAQRTPENAPLWNIVQFEDVQGNNTCGTSLYLALPLAFDQPTGRRLVGTF